MDVPSIALAARKKRTPSSRREPSRRSPREAARGLSVVIVDDHDDLRAVFAEGLEHDGWSVRAFARAADALASIAAERPDIVLTDINLHGLTGRGLARSLLADPRTESIPIVAVSGSVVPTNRMLRAFDAWLTKPVDLATLSTTLLGLVGPRD